MANIAPLERQDVHVLTVVQGGTERLDQTMYRLVLGLGSV